MPASKPARGKIARTLADAQKMGDRTAAKLHGVSVRTVARWRSAARKDPTLRSRLRRLESSVDAGWVAERARLLRALCERAIELAPLTNDLEAVVRSLAKIGEIQVASAALGVDSAPETASDDDPDRVVN